MGRIYQVFWLRNSVVRFSVWWLNLGRLLPKMLIFTATQYLTSRAAPGLLWRKKRSKINQLLYKTNELWRHKIFGVKGQKRT